MRQVEAMPIWVVLAMALCRFGHGDGQLLVEVVVLLLVDLVAQLAGIAIKQSEISHN